MSSRWVKLRQFRNGDEVARARAVLETHGIICEVRDCPAGSASPSLIGYEIRVVLGDLDRASDLLTDQLPI